MLIKCSVCHSSNVANTSIARCEPCDQNWHLHCADPPLSRALGVKLVCPNNKDHILRKLRRPKNGKIFTPSKSESEIPIVVPSSEEALSEDDTADSVTITNFEDTDNGFSAPFPKERYKVMNKDGYVYRLPALGIKLDFIQAVYEMREDQFPDTRNSEILLSLDEIASRNDRPIVRQETGPGLPVSHSDQRARIDAIDIKDETPERSNLELLVESALSLPAPSKLGLERPKTTHRNGKLKSDILDHNTSVKSSNHSVVKTRSSSPQESNDSIVQEVIHPDERSHLIAIKRLMELKGKEALLEFFVS